MSNAETNLQYVDDGMTSEIKLSVIGNVLIKGGKHRMKVVTCCDKDCGQS
jgi:hypothetical protein